MQTLEILTGFNFILSYPALNVYLQFNKTILEILELIFVCVYSRLLVSDVMKLESIFSSNF